MTGVRTGVDQIASGEVQLAQAATLALLGNQAARTSDGQWTGDALRAAGYRVGLLLTPEHGLTAAAGAGEAIPHASLEGIPVLSMYGADQGPVEEALARIDTLLVDLPDVGCRYYTYSWTLRESLKLAARHDVQVTVLDRPNPLGGLTVEGNLPERIDSAVCAARVPVRHGLTLGELALWHQHALSLDVDIAVVATAGWSRESMWPETGLPWVPPSPALRSPEAAFAYPGTCLLEGTNISEGRGTDRAFLLAGAPFVDGTSLARTLEQSPFLAGAALEPAGFTPASGKWAATPCTGVRLSVRDAAVFQPVRAGLALIEALSRMDGFQFRPAHFDALAGTSTWRTHIAAGHSVDEITQEWDSDERQFREERGRAIPSGSLYPA